MQPAPLVPTEHPVRALILTAQLPLWKLRFALGGSPSEATLSRMLRGIELMPQTLSEKIERIIKTA